MKTVRYHYGRFPPKDLDWQALIPLVGPAAGAVARYDGMLAAVPNPKIFLASLAIREAVLSSRIEGIQATIAEVLEFEAGKVAQFPERRADIHEILNYLAAMRQAEGMLSELPLSQRVVREAHCILLSGVRGKGKSPGEYRRVPNWIGPPGCAINEAKFVPVDIHRLHDAMSEWERYIHQDAPDRLVQLAVLHAEFEAIHPFLDGNGRLGRMLVPLFLWNHGLIVRPAFHISAYFESRREAYYDGLLAVSRCGDWTGWCRFFLDAVRCQAEDDLARIRAILKLHEDMKFRVPRLTRSQYVIRALDWIFQHPIFSGADFAAKTGIPQSTARRLLGLLTESGILASLAPGQGRRPGLFAFPELLDITERDTLSGLLR